MSAGERMKDCSPILCWGGERSWYKEKTKEKGKRSTEKANGPAYGNFATGMKTKQFGPHGPCLKLMHLQGKASMSI